MAPGASHRTIVVMPAYNAARTLERTVADLPEGEVDEVILVDDASTDDTVAIARRLGLTVVEHEQNRGYGANQKTCYGLALEHGADYVVMVHPDYQYDSRLICHMVGFLRAGVCDLLLGNRIRTRREALACGMPVWKYLSNRALTLYENLLLGQNLGEFHSGLRAYTRALLETVRWDRNDDGFAFDTQLLIQAVACGFRLGDVPVPVRYFDEASSIRFMPSLQYGIRTVMLVLRYLLHRLGLRDQRLLPKERPWRETPLPKSGGS